MGLKLTVRCIIYLEKNYLFNKFEEGGWLLHARIPNIFTYY